MPVLVMVRAWNMGENIPLYTECSTRSLGIKHAHLVARDKLSRLYLRHVHVMGR